MGHARSADMHIPLPSPHSGNGWLETWISPTPVMQARHGAIGARYNQQILWGCFSLDISPTRPCADDIAHLYAQALQWLSDMGYPHLLRIWNFIAHVNAINCQGLETYRDFNAGRARALAQHYHDQPHGLHHTAGHLAATTAIGTGGHAVNVYFLAGRARGLHLENPFQMAAWRYPQQHGPRPPCFARATLTRWDAQRALFVSGTASIVGHQSIHTRVQEQTRLALQHVARMAQRAGRRMADLTHAKVYVRRARDIPLVEALCRQALPPTCQIGYLVGDICRSNLWMELEVMQL